MTDMEKYGVEEEAPEAAKVAAEKSGTCPDCGRPLLRKEVTGVLLCSMCGSKPFEEKLRDPSKHR